MTSLEPELGQPIDLSSAFAPSVPEPVQPVPTLTPEQITANLNGTPAPAVLAPRDTSAIIPNLPDTQSAFTRKYQRLAPMLAKVPSQTRATLVQMDWDRVQKGQAPLSDKQTLAALIQASQANQLTKKESGDGSLLDAVMDVPSNAIKDVGLILKSIPQLPGALVNEVTSLDDIPEVIKENQEAGMNPLAAILNAPGIRFIPGSYVAGNLAQGTEGLKELAEHPTIAALDVLPYAGKLASGTKVAQQAAVEAGAKAASAAELRAVVAGEAPQAVAEIAEAAGRRAINGARPLRAVLTRKLLPDGAVDPVTLSRLTPNALGKVTTKAAESSVGQLVNEAFGPVARDVGATAMQANERLQRVFNTNIPVTGFEETARAATDLRITRAAKDYGLTVDDLVDLTKRAELGEAGWLNDLPAPQAAFMDEVMAMTRQVESEAVARDFVRVVDGEVYDVPRARQLMARRTRYSKMVERFSEGRGAKMAAIADEYRAGLYGPDEGVPVLNRPGEALKQRGVEKVEAIDAAIQAATDGTGTWADALAEINKAMQGRTNIGSPSVVGPAIPNAPVASERLGTLAGLRDDVRKLVKAEKDLRKVEAAPPDRWIRRVQEEAKAPATTRLIAAGMDPEAAARFVVERNFKDVDPRFARILEDTTREVGAAWQKMKAAGHDPLYVHRVTSGKEGLLVRPQVSGRAINPSLSKARSLQAKPSYYEDLTVGLDHSAREILQRDATEAMLQHIEKAYALPVDEVMARYEAAGIKWAEANPRRDPAAFARMAMERDFTTFDPTKYGGFASDAPMVVPKVVIKSLDRMFDPKPNGILNSVVFDKTTGMFRTSVLALSPRWHIYNMVGGAIMLGAEDLRAFAPSNIAKSLRLLKAARNGELVFPERMQFALGSVMKELDADRASFMTGLDEASKLQRFAESKAGQATGKFVKGSYALNGWFDDVYRVMSYLNGEKQALGKGLSDDAAREVAMESVRRTSQVWVELSPFERQVLRKVFPFYSFTAKIMKLVTQYPFDHPVRAAVMANIAAAELADMGDALPTDWIATTGIGDVDEEGNQTRLNWRGLNPFNDVGDMFTVAGFLQGMNPIIATVGEQLTGDPYAEKVYNPETGKLEQPKPNLLRSLVGNTVPQASVAMATLGLDKSMSDLKRTNPEAYQRMIASGMGFPTGARTMNATRDKIMAELNRQTAQREAWAAFLRSGDTTEVEKYPALRPLIPLVQQARSSGAYQAYNPLAGAQSGASGLVSAVAGQAPWPT